MTQISRLIWNPAETPDELKAMLTTLSEEYPVFDSGRGLKIKFSRVKAKSVVSRVVRSRGTVNVGYSTVTAAARGLGSALAGLETDEETPFESLGIMLDCSRNRVMTVDGVKKWMRRLALNGCNLILLYCEDTYELPGHKYFGAYRGGYTFEELREMDEYAARLGIELVGCIQTLGHMEQSLKWFSAFDPVRDTMRVMNVGNQATYDLIGEMLDFWSRALRSRRIHIGMDEAHDIGLGLFMDKNGFTPQFELFSRHLAKVCGICGEKGLHPEIWSDMFFRLSNSKRDYYDYTHKIPEKVRRMIPDNVTLAYWDYYNSDRDTYENMIKAHRDLGRPVSMASGIWTWTRLWYDHAQTVKTVVPCIAACRKQKIKELYFTMWGDNGAYCNWDSALAGITYAADLAYGASGKNADKDTAARFAAVCQSDYEAVLQASRIQTEWSNYGTCPSPAALIWDDPLLGIVCNTERDKDPDFAVKLMDRYEEALCRILPFAEENAAGDFDHAVNILQLLIAKLELRGGLTAAYDRDDRVALRQIANVMIPHVIAAVEAFDRSFRRQWLNGGKPFGLEEIQIRNAGQIARLRETALRVSEYLAGERRTIEELDNRICDPEHRMEIYTYCKSKTGCTDLFLY